MYVIKNMRFEDKSVRASGGANMNENRLKIV